MANKKCPKCGEDNPAEAVMCWACYTPLTASAGATMGAGAGMGGGGTATMPRAGTAIIPGADDGAAKKQIDPKIFFVAGGLLFAALIGAFTTGMIGGGGGGGETGITVTDSGSTTPRSMTTIPNTSPGPSSPSGPAPGPSGPDAPPPTPSQAWTMVVSPSPRYATATFAIAPTQPGISVEQAKTMARQARQQYVSNGKWTKTQIVVFSTPDSGQGFKQYMSQRRGEPLGQNDYANLAQSGTWNNAVLYYVSVGNGEKPYYPSKSPNGWWGGA